MEERDVGLLDFGATVLDITACPDAHAVFGVDRGRPVGIPTAPRGAEVLVKLFDRGSICVHVHFSSGACRGRPRRHEGHERCSQEAQPQQ